MTMGSRKTVPPRMLRIVPLGDSHTRHGQYVGVRASWGGLTLLEVELLDSLLVRGNCSAFDANRIFQNSLCCVDSDLVIRLVSIWQAKVVVFEVDVEVWMDELVFDVLPYYARHLISVQLDDGILDFDLGGRGGGIASTANARGFSGKPCLGL